jgi:outer membrane protein assembly factor BamB
MRKELITIIIISVLLLLSAVSVSATKINIEDIDKENQRKISTNENNIWPMFRQNPQHTGQSQYYTNTNPGLIKWTFRSWRDCCTSPAIDSDGVIYIGVGTSQIDDGILYAINPDGSKKWEFEIYAEPIRSSPALSKDEKTIYFGCDNGKLYAVSTYFGSLKWTFKTERGISSSPVVSSDGTIYVGSKDHYLYAIEPSGDLKWKFDVCDEVYSSPAIGYDGTIYVGSYGKNLTAINSDGALKWKFLTLGRVSSSPAIGSDGTIYFGSEDNILYAVNSDGFLKWEFLTGDDIIWSSPAIGSDGTIYVGSYDDCLYAVDPYGSLKWKYKTDNYIKSSPAVSADDFIYIGGVDYNLYALNSQGDLQWKLKLSGIVSSPAIGSDGIIYVGAQGYFYAIGENENGDAPYKPERPYGGPSYGETYESYCYDTVTTDPNGDGIRYYFDWGDGTGDWTDYRGSGIQVSMWHAWEYEGAYKIKVKAEDREGHESEWSDPFVVTMPRKKVVKLPSILFLKDNIKLSSFVKQIFQILERR